MNEIRPSAGEGAPGESRPSLESLVTGWWRSLQQRRGDRAALRRANTPTDVAFTPAFHRLAGLLREAGVQVPLEWLAVAASALAHVEIDESGKTLAQAMAAEKGGKARVSGMRFRRLLRVDDPEEMLVAIGRVIRLLDRGAPVARLARDLTRWNDRTKKRWASEYYQVAPDES